MKHPNGDGGGPCSINQLFGPAQHVFHPHYHGTDWCDCLTKLRSTVHLNIDEPPFRHKSPTLDKCVNLKADLCRGGSIVGRVSALWAFNKTRIYNYMTAYITEVNKEKVFQIISDAPNWQRFEIRMTVFPFLPPLRQKKRLPKTWRWRSSYVLDRGKPVCWAFVGLREARERAKD